jgi:hypothetical protein
MFAGGQGDGSGGREAFAGNHGEADRRPALLLFLALVLVFGARAAASYRPLTFLVGDGPYYAATAVSLLYDRDLDLTNQLEGGLAIHGRQIALGRDGAWYPKHPILMPIAASPFLLALGMPGLLAFNILVMGLLGVVLMRLARPAAPAWAASAAAFLLIAGTFLRRYDYNFSPDLFATLLLASGLLALQRGRDLGGGLVLGLAVAAKLTHLFLLPLGVIYAGAARGWRAGLQAASATAPPLLALAALNLALFGSPFVTSYDRNVGLEGGEAVTLSHRGLFDQSAWRGLSGELFDSRHGLLPTSPPLLLALPGFVLLLRRRPLDAVLHLAVAEFLLLFFATYRYWATSHYGNRFLMPVAAVACPSVALALQWIAAWARARALARRGPAMQDAAP